MAVDNGFIKSKPQSKSGPSLYLVLSFYPSERPKQTAIYILVDNLPSLSPSLMVYQQLRMLCRETQRKRETYASSTRSLPTVFENGIAGEIIQKLCFLGNPESLLTEKFRANQCVQRCAETEICVNIQIPKLKTKYLPNG